jgi:hypothetical protein
MTGPDTAMDGMTGQPIQLQHADTSVTVYQRSRDQGTAVDANEACAGARKAAAGRFNKAADDRVQELCRFGRSLYDQPQSGRP